MSPQTKETPSKLEIKKPSSSRLGVAKVTTQKEVKIVADSKPKESQIIRSNFQI